MRFNKHSQLLTAIATLLLTTPLWATNGYFTHGTGAKNKALAGSGLAMPEDAISIANNPAAALANAGKYDVGIAVFSPSRHYKTSESQANGQGGAFTIGPNDIDSSNNAFFIPHIAGAWKLSEESAWGAAFYGRGGMVVPVARPVLISARLILILPIHAASAKTSPGVYHWLL